MTDRRLAPPLLACGLLLVALGLACWAGGLDLPLHHALRLGGDRTVREALWLTALGGFTVQGPLALAAVAGLAVARRWRDAAWLFAATLVARLAVEGVKLLVHRPRPPVADRLADVSSWSFPSSHAAGTMLTCLLLARLFGGTRALVAAIVFAVAIGWSRAALGVHWPGDVLAGWGFGMALAGLALAFRPRSSEPFAAADVGRR